MGNHRVQAPKNSFSAKQVVKPSLSNVRRTLSGLPANHLSKSIFDSHDKQIAVSQASGFFDFGSISIFPKSKTPVSLSSQALPIQAKLKIGQPNDKYEQEADWVAEQVIRMPFTSEEKVAKPVTDFSGGSRETVQAALQPKTNKGSGNLETPAGFSSDLAVNRGEGQALSDSPRLFMENAFAEDFSQVRIHTGLHAANMCERIQANAFTTGTNIYFGQRQFNPHTVNGKRLLAHELTHVTQNLDAIQRDPAADAENAKIAKLKADIATAFGLESVEDGDENWTSAELTIAQQALAMIPAEDKSALKGVVLKRVVSLGGKTAGKFSSSQSVSGTNVINDFMIELADLTFSSADQKATVIHEIGHAIATHKSRVARTESFNATAEFNKKVGETNAAVVPFNEANDETNEAADAYNDKVVEFNAADSAERKKIKPDLDTLRKDYEAKKKQRDSLEETHKAKEKLQAAAESVDKEKKKIVAAAKISIDDLTAIKTAADSAKTSHDATLAAVLRSFTDTMKTGAEATVYFDALQAASTTVTDFFSQTKDQSKDEDAVDGLVASVNTTIETRDNAAKVLNSKDPKNTLHPASAALEKAQNDFFEAAKAQSLAHNRNKRVQNFVKFVTTKTIAPITPYALENWPHKPEEFYAEAYSFWVSKKLAAASTELDQWFVKGNYKK